MNIQRFHAPTSREALAKARMAFGEGTLILSNRPTATGVEVLATAEDTLNSLDQPQEAPSRTAAAPKPAAVASKPAKNAPPTTQSQVEEDAEQLAMSTLSFQDYVRERMLRRRHDSLKVIAQDTPAPAATRLSESAAPVWMDAPMSAPKQPAVSSPKVAAQPAQMPQGIVDELQAMKDMIEERFNTLAWLGQAKQNPIQSNLMLKLIRAGYSPALARAMLEKLPDSLGATESVRWVMDVLERNLKTDTGRSLPEEGGVYALVGATGVGKTTTTAKLAGLCARQYGPASVGLITLDTYRIGAHEQLRTYGRMLGVVAHLAHDQAALQDLLNLLSNKKMILIDTTGVAPRDPRKRELLDVLDLPNVNRLLVLNAGGQGETLDEVVSSFRSTGVQQAVLSKIDEAVKLGPALDAAIRHQLVLRGVTTGQRVPEDWESADASKLVRLSMRTPNKSAFDPQASDLGFIFSQPAVPSQGMIHA
ncbi:flagellar biosynthesis protein FlhF [Curvibacter delicatus]|jgi:flagellar biosynthesis protein FlhF|uniref:flagellar biosynthesis protein FlhF n=1 Tax=Curvibacter delicatus TaxID=80879 RepID=UPI00082AE6D6|nr:flagellar biosynthesis protein FlhF [Curvibacter delicatus]